MVIPAFRITVLVYVGTFLIAYFLGEKIIFQPPPSSYQDTNQIIKLDSGDGAQVSAIYLPNAQAHYTILYSHGNAEDIGQLLPIFRLIKEIGFSVFAYDYRGYGTSSGTPSEKNVYKDVDAAYGYLVNNIGIPGNRIIALGRSLGGAVAIDLAHRKQLGGLIIESSFASVYQVVTGIPVFPFDKFENISKIKYIRCPVLVIHGTQDEVIPYRHGKKLFRGANEPKFSFWVHDAKHNDLLDVAGNRYKEALRGFAAVVEDRNNGL